jgi:hypothetical protein
MTHGCGPELILTLLIAFVLPKRGGTAVLYGPDMDPRRRKGWSGAVCAFCAQHVKLVEPAQGDGGAAFPTRRAKCALDRSTTGANAVAGACKPTKGRTLKHPGDARSGH